MPRYVRLPDGRIVPAQSTNIPMQGLGDLVARGTQALGIPSCAPCEERQARLNQLWPFGQPGGQR
jgi:hypothetical protein